MNLSLCLILYKWSVKIKRLKQAQEEAEREVGLYRSHLEAEFQKKIAEVPQFVTILVSINVFNVFMKFLLSWPWIS